MIPAAVIPAAGVLFCPGQHKGREAVTVLIHNELDAVLGQHDLLHLQGERFVAGGLALFIVDVCGRLIHHRLHLAVGCVLAVQAGEVEHVEVIAARRLIGDPVGVGPVDDELPVSLDPDVAVSGVHQVEVFALILAAVGVVQTKRVGVVDDGLFQHGLAHLGFRAAVQLVAAEHVVEQDAWLLIAHHRPVLVAVDGVLRARGRNYARVGAAVRGGLRCGCVAGGRLHGAVRTVNRVEGVGLTPGGVVGHRADGQRANAVPQGVFLAVHLGIQAGVARTAGVGCADGGIEVSEVVSGDVVCTGGNGDRLIRKVEAGGIGGGGGVRRDDIPHLSAVLADGLLVPFAAVGRQLPGLFRTVRAGAVEGDASQMLRRDFAALHVEMGGGDSAVGVGKVGAVDVLPIVGAAADIQGHIHRRNGNRTDLLQGDGAVEREFIICICVPDTWAIQRPLAAVAQY